jgi:hypothetical protein
VAAGVRHPTSTSAPDPNVTVNRRLMVGFVAGAGLYLIASMVTVAMSGHRFRPLYEGVGPAAPYRWVHPPSAFSSTNIAPVATSQSLELTGTGSEQSGAGTPDGQAVLNLPAGALLSSAGQQSVSMSITPVDPAKLGRPPDDLYPDGNAYLITATYQPSGEHIPSAARTIDAVLRTPLSSVAMLTSTDGKSWTPIANHRIPTQAAVATTFTTFGYLLAAADVPAGAPSSSSGTSILVLVVLGLAPAILITISVLWRRRSRRSGG